jgi:hypothetical protein
LIDLFIFIDSAHFIEIKRKRQTYRQTNEQIDMQIWDKY